MDTDEFLKIQLAEIDRVLKENAELRAAIEKREDYEKRIRHLTATLETVNGKLVDLRADNERLRKAVQAMYDAAPVMRADVVAPGVCAQGQLRVIREIGYAALHPLHPSPARTEDGDG